MKSSIAITTISIKDSGRTKNGLNTNHYNLSAILFWLTDTTVA